MLRFLRRLFDWSGKPSDELSATQGNDSNDSDDFALLNREVPLQTADQKQNSFVRREAILDRAERIAGYEFSLLTTLKAHLHRRGGMAKRAYDAALLTRLGLHGVTSLLGHRLAFVGLSVESLSNVLIDQLPLQNTVLILELGRQIPDWDVAGVRIAELKQKGFVLGLMIHDATDVTCPLTSHLDFIQIDVTAFDGIDLRSLTSELRINHATETSPLRLVARDVQSHDDFQFCFKCGFDYFQGPFVTSRESFNLTSGGVNRIAVLPILNLVRNDKSFALIADQLKNEPTLSYKLLRYLNSPAMGLQQPSIT